MKQTMLRTIAQLEAALNQIRLSPREDGRLELIVRRPSVDAREVLADGTLDASRGLLGDSWHQRGNSPNRQKQITLMNARAIDIIAGTRDQWQLAGDQLFVDFDLSVTNIPTATRLAIGTAIIEITAPPHRGCSKFTARFGPDATAFVNSVAGVELNLRGVNATVVQTGLIRTGDAVRKSDRHPTSHDRGPL